MLSGLESHINNSKMQQIIFGYFDNETYGVRSHLLVGLEYLLEKKIKFAKKN